MSHEITIPSNFGRALRSDIEAGRVTDEHRVMVFDRLVSWAAWLEEETEIDTLSNLQMENKRLRREIAALKMENGKLKKERDLRKARSCGATRSAHADRYLAESIPAQIDYCWKQRERGEVA